jgi:hypothetical protein
MFMVLAFIGAGSLPRPADWWQRLRPLAWGVLGFSALLHAQITFYQSFHTPTPDVNVIRAFVALNPLVREVLPGPRAEEEEAIARNDLGTVYLRLGRTRAALREFERAYNLSPYSEVIQQNLELARDRLERQN